MNVLERYVLRRMLGALALSFVALSMAVWVTQALRQFDLVTARGQSFLTFFKASTLIFPALVVVIVPVSVLIAVTFTLNALNNDSELAIINSSGARQRVLLKPVLVVAAIGMTIVASCTIFLAPLATRQARALLEEVNADILSQFIREGQFLSIGEGVTIHIKERTNDGVLESIFLSDKREPDEWVTYLARRGAIIDVPTVGRFLVMEDGVIHRQSQVSDTTSLIEFENYGFDLTTFASRAATTSFGPNEQPTAYLLNPDPDDTYFQQYPDRFIAEFHERMATPLYILVFALVPLAYLGQAQSNRRGRTISILSTTLVCTLIRGTGFVLSSIATGPVLLFLLYSLPIITGILAVLALYSRFPLVTLEFSTKVVDVLARPFGGIRRRLREAIPAAPAAE